MFLLSNLAKMFSEGVFITIKLSNYAIAEKDT